MKVINPGHAVFVMVKGDRRLVESGEEVDLPARQAKSLLNQGWEKPTPKEQEKES